MRLNLGSTHLLRDFSGWNYESKFALWRSKDLPKSMCSCRGYSLDYRAKSEESLAVSLPGPLACLSGSHFCLKHNILLCQPSAENCCCPSFLLARQSRKTWSEHCVFLCFGGSLLCSCSWALGLHQREDLWLQKSTQANCVHYNQFFLLNQFGGQGISPL